MLNRFRNRTQPLKVIGVYKEKILVYGDDNLIHFIKFWDRLIDINFNVF